MKKLLKMGAKGELEEEEEEEEEENPLGKINPRRREEIIFVVGAASSFSRPTAGA